MACTSHQTPAAAAAAAASSAKTAGAKRSRAMYSSSVGGTIPVMSDASLRPDAQTMKLRNTMARQYSVAARASFVGYAGAAACAHAHSQQSERPLILWYRMLSRCFHFWATSPNTHCDMGGRVGVDQIDLARNAYLDDRRH